MIEHRWNLSPSEAVRLQRDLAPCVISEDDLCEPKRVAGIDVGFQDGGRLTRAAVAVLEFENLALIDSAIATCPTCFPYVPGLLSFRELPAAMAALRKLTVPPDLLLCDGQGYAHPRRFGLACHLGVLSDIPSIGVGKRRLTGEFDPPPDLRGSWSPLTDKGEVIGAVLRTRAGFKPVFVSVGHRVGLESAVRLTMHCTKRFKLPETTRAAHRLASGNHHRAGKERHHA